MKHTHKDDSGTFDCPLGSECPPISASEAECRIMAWIEYHETKGRTLSDAEAKEHQHRAKNYRIVLAPLQAERQRLNKKLSEACDLIIGAAAWLEKSDQAPIGAGLRKWVAEKGK